MLVGAINTGVTYAIYLLLLLFAPYLLAYSIAYLLGIIISYVLNSKLVFKESLAWSKFLKFPLIYVIQYLLNTVLLLLSVDILNINEKLALVLSIMLTTPITYLLSKRVIQSQK
ncbi:GtrA family protein [Cohnella suwonensis]|uniref:GtrA family protein n=1 Tax=Cohnella suwonensis TaxID=696072 RepID=A0ABW0LV68_9BACL